MRYLLIIWTITYLSVAMVVAGSNDAYAQQLPGPADAGRIQTTPQEFIPSKQAPLIIPDVRSGIEIPDAAREIRFHLNAIRLEGVSIFTQEELAAIYQPSIGQDMTLATIWEIAGAITQRYRDHHYFLSRAYVPAQEIEGGVVTIRVVEGYVGEVMVEDRWKENRLIRRYVEELTGTRPVTTDVVESFLLRLNDLSQTAFSGTLEMMDGEEEGAVRLQLSSTERGGQGSFRFDNEGSRYLGPYQASVVYLDSFLPLQRTQLSVLSTLQPDELKYISIQHDIPIDTDWSIQLSGLAVDSNPGYVLKDRNIESSTYTLGISAKYQLIRQRQENLALTLGLDGRNAASDIEGTELSEDHVRTARAGLTYDTADKWDGYNMIRVTLSQGLEIVNSSSDGDLNLSRAEADPDFTKLEWRYSRQQLLGQEILMVGQIEGQLASSALFSSEEFGFGGSGLGRAYDMSEMTGDHGLAAAIEMRYLGIPRQWDSSLAPFVFYDIGKVWNEDRGAENVSGSSAGLGLRVSHETGLNSSIGVAFPLTRSAEAPLYGNGKNPRLMFRIGYDF